jgi:hypothetical protein
MKMKQLFAICGLVAALFCGASIASAQDNGGANGAGNGGNGGGGGGNGGGRRNFDPQQMEQRMMDGVRDQLEFTNDADWSQVQPLVQKVFDARRDVGFGGGMGRMFGGRNRGGQNADQNGRPRGGMFGTPSPEAQALQTAIDNNAPASQIKGLMDKYRASQKAKQDKLKQAQENLRAVLTVKQEAQATLLGLVD